MQSRCGVGVARLLRRVSGNRCAVKADATGWPNEKEALKDLDEAGIIRIGAEVHAGDILVGKITPKGETQLSPEEKLLRAIFGEKAGDVRDTSLRVSPGVTGTVIDAKVFARKGVDKDERALAIEEAEEARLLKDQTDEIKIIKESARRKIFALLKGKSLTARLIDDKGKVQDVVRPAVRSRQGR